MTNLVGGGDAGEKGEKVAPGEGPPKGLGDDHSGTANTMRGSRTTANGRRS